MDGGQASDNHPVTHHDMAGQGAIVREDAVVADLAVVRDVRVSQEVVVAADRGAVFRVRSSMDGGELPEGVVVSDLAVGRFAFGTSDPGFAGRSMRKRKSGCLSQP